MYPFLQPFPARGDTPPLQCLEGPLGPSSRRNARCNTPCEGNNGHEETAMKDVVFVCCVEHLAVGGLQMRQAVGPVSPQAHRSGPADRGQLVPNGRHSGPSNKYFVTQMRS